MKNEQIPRRCRIDQMCAAELAILKAMEEVEKMDADIRLTDAVNFLGKAKDRVADFIDGTNKETHPLFNPSLKDLLQ